MCIATQRSMGGATRSTPESRNSSGWSRPQALQTGPYSSSRGMFSNSGGSSNKKVVRQQWYSIMFRLAFHLPWQPETLNRIFDEALSLCLRVSQFEDLHTVVCTRAGTHPIENMQTDNVAKLPAPPSAAGNTPLKEELAFGLISIS